MNQKIAEIVHWLVASSADPKQVSLTVRGVILVAGSQAIRLFDIACSFGLACVGIDSAFVNQLAETVELVTYAGLLLIGALWTLYGLVRKVYHGRWSAPVEN